MESVKSVSEIYSPISGKIINVNNKLEDNPEIINENPYDDGWLVEISITNEKEIVNLLDPKEYKKLIE